MSLTLLSFLLERLNALDRKLFFLINEVLRNPLFDWLMPFVTGARHFAVPLLLLSLALLIWGGRKGRSILLSALILVILADASAGVLKGLFERPRPCQALTQVSLLVGCSSSFSLPSNHAVNAFALATLFAFYYRKLAFPLFAMAVLVGYSRVYVGVHYPLDVLMGALWGTTLALAFVHLSRRLLGRWGENRLTGSGGRYYTRTRRRKDDKPGAGPLDDPFPRCGLSL